MLLRPLLAAPGYIHRADLTESGWRPDRIRRAVVSEGLIVVRRQWIVDRSAPFAFLLAATHGGRVACVSAGEFYGLWRPGHSARPHLRLKPHQTDRCAEAVVHRSLDIAPASPRNLVEPVVNVLAQVAVCLPHEDGLGVWESALRTGLIDGNALTNIDWRGERARELAREAGLGSDSGLESLFVRRSRRAGIPMRQQVILLKRPVDGLIGERLVVQIDGYAFHKDARQRRADIAHDRALRLAGYTVLRFDYHQVVNEWPRVEAEIRAAMAQRLHLAAR